MLIVAAHGLVSVTALNIIGLPVAAVLYYVFSRSVDVAAERRVADAEAAELEQTAERSAGR